MNIAKFINRSMHWRLSNFYKNCTPQINCICLLYNSLIIKRILLKGNIYLIAQMNAKLGFFYIINNSKSYEVF